MDDITLRREDAKDILRSGQTPDSSIPPGARQFPCVKCGGPLVYMPGSTFLKCPYCGTENQIPIDKDDKSFLIEQDFEKALEEENRYQEEETEAPAKDAILCTYCGATTTINERKTSDLCPYCGHPLAMQNLVKYRLNVQAVLPFQLDGEKATLLYRNWVKSRWFAPNDFKRRVTRGEAMKGCYMPYWTYNSASTTWYTGQRGTVFYTTQMVPVTRGGRTFMEPRQVMRVRWTPVSGKVQLGFENVLIPASKSVPLEIQEGLKPWSLDKLEPFRQEFLAGFVTETYQVPLKNGFDNAKQRMDPDITNAVRQDIGGDQQRITSKKTQYSKITFKHILLPIWLSAYAYGGKTYRFTINAQTGEVSGDRPYSVWKIALAVILGLILMGILFFGLFGDDMGMMQQQTGPSVQIFSPF